MEQFHSVNPTTRHKAAIAIGRDRGNGRRNKEFELNSTNCVCDALGQLGEVLTDRKKVNETAL